MRKIEIKYPIIFNRVAKDLANDRTIGMHKNYKNKDYYWGDKTRELNEQGILAELIAQYFLDTKVTKYKALSFLGQEPEVEADLVIDPDINCDVKFIPHYGKFLLVNFRSHTNTAKKVDSYIFVKPTKEVMVCAISRIDVQAFHSWRLGRPLIWPQYHQTHGLEFCPNLVPMRRKCSRIRLYPFLLTSRFSLNPYKTVWTGRKRNLPIVSPRPNLPESPLPKPLKPKRWMGSTPPSTGKTPVIMPMTGKN